MIHLLSALFLTVADNKYLKKCSMGRADTILSLGDFFSFIWFAALAVSARCCVSDPH